MGVFLDKDVDIIYNLYRCLIPEFTKSHALIYRLLWRVEPLSGDKISKETGICRAKTFAILKQLVLLGLVKKTSFKPIGYFARDPAGAYSSLLRKVLPKLESGRTKIKELVQNSSSLSGEVYLIKLDGGQQTIISKETREYITDRKALEEIRAAIDRQIFGAKPREKTWAIYR